MLRVTQLSCRISLFCGSWLSLVERWFAELTNKQLRRGAYKSVPKLKAAIQEFIDAHQEHPKPFVWTKTADQILASIARFAQPRSTSRPRNMFTNHWDGTLELRVRDLAVLFLHLIATVARVAGPGGARSVVAESVLVKHQLLILNRSRKRSPNLRPADRVVVGLCALFMRPGRLIRSAIVLKPSTLLRLHRALVQRKYRRLFFVQWADEARRRLRGKSIPREVSTD